MEGREKNMITVIYHLDGNPHEITIKDTKYFVKEIYASEKHKNAIITVSHHRVLSQPRVCSAGTYSWGARLTYSGNRPS